MATLKSLGLAARLLRPRLAHRSLSTTNVIAASWNKDWKPGPVPTTPEERAAAAKKYGLRVEDYDIYTDDGTGHGDYPKLPYTSGDSRDPYANWDIPELKRNWNEPLHADYDMIGEDRWDANANPRYSYRFMYLFTLGVLGTLGLLFVLAEPYPAFLPAMPKQYPFNDLHLEKGGSPVEEPTITHYRFLCDK